MDDSILFEEPKVDLVATAKGTEDARLGPEELSAYGSFGCFEEKSSLQLYREHKSNLSEEELRKRMYKVLRESMGRGHGSVSDQNHFIFVIENLTRAATLQLCLPHYLAHLQQSLRRATADRAFYVPEAIRISRRFLEVKDVLSNSFKLYDKARTEVPSEDARYILPLYTKTNIQSCTNARELMHIHSMNNQGEVPTAVKTVIESMLRKARSIAPLLFQNWGANYETLAWYPSAQLYSNENKTLNEIIEKYKTADKVVFVEHELSEEAIEKAVKQRNETELSNIKHIHNGGMIEGFLLPMTITTYHQSTRQRTWDHAIESIYDAVKRGNMILPPSVKESEFVDEYKEQFDQMMALYNNLLNDGVARSEAIGVIPHCVQMYDMIHVNGWNSIHSIGKRTCKEAQWEIRGLANQIATIIREKNKTLGKYTMPQGVVYGKCPERVNCGMCDEILKSRGEK